jgi:hypothetical protein
MAPSPPANDPGERYAELERAYIEDRWPDVLKQGGQLIADLSNDPDPVTADLTSRAHLLLGHAHLYGLRDPAAALPFYQALLGGPADPDLRRIAEEALPYCQPPVEPAAPSAEQAGGVFTTATATDATPWLDAPIRLEKPIRVEKSIETEVGGMLTAPSTTIGEVVPSLEVEVVEEPELVEVAQADPSLAEELEIELTRIRERRASSRFEASATEKLVTAAPAVEAALEEPDDLMEDPELLAGLLRVVVTP